MTTPNNDTSGPLHRPDPAAVDAAVASLDAWIQEARGNDYGPSVQHWYDVRTVLTALDAAKVALSARDEALQLFLDSSYQSIGWITARTQALALLSAAAAPAEVGREEGGAEG